MAGYNMVSVAAGAGAGLALGYCLFGRRAGETHHTHDHDHDHDDFKESTVHRVDEDPRRRVFEDGTMFYDDEGALGEVHPGAKMLPGNIYGDVVRRMPVVCVDVVLRNPEGKVLIVKRGMHPVKGYWWLPGGRIFKGETFFRAAVRKAHQETGILCAPVKLLGVYNTLFPTSSWDDPEFKGTHTVNGVVLMELGEGQHVKLDHTSEEHRWISTDVDAAVAAGYDRYIVEQLRRMEKLPAPGAPGKGCC